jgi:hypothetical protein
LAAAFVRDCPRNTNLGKCCSPLKTIWLAAFQPCGERLEANLPDWPPVYEQERRLLNTALRQTLLARLT